MHYYYYDYYPTFFFESARTTLSSSSSEQQPQQRSLLDLARTFHDQDKDDIHPNKITATACLRTIFGGKNDRIEETVLRWVAYNRLLGFDHILVWWAGHNVTPPGLVEELALLPFVTLVENTRHPQPDPIWTTALLNGNHPGGQNQDIAECFRLTKNMTSANHQHWIFLGDADEYLWFADQMRLKEFLHLHQDKNYLSFGKWMYDDSLEYVHAQSDLFGLEKYPYTYKSYCKNQRGNKYCPDWFGRSKVMFRRDSYETMPIHGISGPVSPKRNGRRIHFNTDVAHIKEWKNEVDGYTLPGSFLNNNHNNTTYETAGIKTNASKLIVPSFPDGVDAFEMTPKGNYTLYRDVHLQEWFDFVANTSKTIIPTQPQQQRRRQKR